MDARLIDSPPLDGAMNMALDETLLASIAEDGRGAQVAVLKAVLEHLRTDVADVGSAASSSDQTLEIGIMVLNQTWRLILLKLESSPSLLALSNFE